MPAYPDLEHPVFTAGGVPFEFLFESYVEQTNLRAGNTFIKARVAWVDKEQFLTDVQGFSLGFAGELFYYRILPLIDPVNSNLYCTDVKLVDYASSSIDDRPFGGVNYYPVGQNPTKEDPQKGGMFAMDWAIYGLTFSRLPYFAVDNDTVYAASSTYTHTPAEALRYNMIAFRPRAREFSVNSYTLQVSPPETPPKFLGVPAFVMDREMDLVVTIMQVPATNFPFHAIQNTLGAINSVRLDLPLSFTPAVVDPVSPATWKMQTFDVNTLLFRGVATDITTYQGPDGRWYCDIPYFFTYRPNGWLYLPNPAGTGVGNPVLVSYVGSTPEKFLYDQVNFFDLWIPDF